MPKGWFGPKIEGDGVRTWQGWVALAVFVAGIFAIRRFAGPELAPLLDLHAGPVRLALTGVWIAGFLILIWATYDPEA